MWPGLLAPPFGIFLSNTSFSRTISVCAATRCAQHLFWPCCNGVGVRRRAINLAPSPTPLHPLATCGGAPFAFWPRAALSAFQKEKETLVCRIVVSRFAPQRLRRYSQHTKQGARLVNMATWRPRHHAVRKFMLDRFSRRKPSFREVICRKCGLKIVRGHFYLLQKSIKIQ